MFENVNKDGYKPQEGSNGGYNKIVPGGYVCKIYDVYATKDADGAERINVEFDIVEGEFKGYYTNLKTTFNKARRGIYSFRLMYDGKIGKNFNGLAGALEKSNPGFKADCIFQKGGEKGWIGKGFGAIIGQEQYTDKTTGIDKTAMKVFYARSVESIRNNDYEMPTPRDGRTKVNTNTGANPFVPTSDSLEGLFTDNSKDPLPF